MQHSPVNNIQYNYFEVIFYEFLQREGENEKGCFIYIIMLLIKRDLLKQ